jgi:mRNA interferase HigB
MRFIARSNLAGFGLRHPQARQPLMRWHAIVKGATWLSTDDIQRAVPNCKVLNHERVRFQIGGGRFRLIAAFDFKRQIAYIKFIGTHAEYDAVDALTIAQF